MTDTNTSAELSSAAFGLTTETMNIDSSAIKRIGDLATSAAALRTMGNTHIAILPEGFHHHDISDLVEKRAEAPRRKSGTYQVGAIDSFLRVIEDHGLYGSTYVYADVEQRTLTAVMNEHQAETETTTEGAGWRDFRVVFKAELSREFATWSMANKKIMEQEDFAIFIEDNIADVCEPSGEALLQIALNLQAKTEVNFSSAKRLDNGQLQFTYTEAIDARAGNGSIEIPREFKIGLRLFKNGDGYKLRARLKYRLNSGKLKFWYELDRPENVVEDAFNSFIERVQDGEHAVLIGRP